AGQEVVVLPDAPRGARAEEEQRRIGDPLAGRVAEELVVVPRVEERPDARAAIGRLRRRVRETLRDALEQVEGLVVAVAAGELVGDAQRLVEAEGVELRRRGPGEESVRLPGVPSLRKLG